MPRLPRTAEPSNRFIAHGIAHVALPVVQEPVCFTFVLMPQFTMLAFTSAIEPLRVANQLAGQELFRWAVLSEQGAPVACSHGMRVIPDGGLTTAVSPGYVMVCGGVQPELACTAGLTDWLRSQWRHGRRVGGLCTGAYALAKAGILTGRRFTLHWENFASFRESHPDLMPEWQVFTIDDRILTCAGGVAAADLTLKLIHDLYGAQISQAVMNMCLMTRRREGADDQIGSLSARLGTRNENMVRAVAFLERHIEEEFNLDACAAHIGVSRRQIERLFQQYLGVSPLQYLNGLRLQHARALLAETDMSVIDVAVACGYASSAHFSKSFLKKFGISPHKFSHFRKSST